ncbi:hypothetical protein WN51_01281 [Melipona quadrifasciata]|uniref:Uncharacterized protein n=1 Tax=Melipona quadrifasciata TaxID=166423 RepID=A0A0M8ZYK3_9HYME|nr:hypothetical protein WN51_01281 [Melipona quadrifasciata]
MASLQFLDALLYIKLSLSVENYKILTLRKILIKKVRVCANIFSEMYHWTLNNESLELNYLILELPTDPTISSQILLICYVTKLGKLQALNRPLSGQLLLGLPIQLYNHGLHLDAWIHTFPQSETMYIVTAIANYPRSIRSFGSFNLDQVMTKLTGFPSNELQIQPDGTSPMKDIKFSTKERPPFVTGFVKLVNLGLHTALDPAVYGRSDGCSDEGRKRKSQRAFNDSKGIRLIQRRENDVIPTITVIEARTCPKQGKYYYRNTSDIETTQFKIYEKLIENISRKLPSYENSSKDGIENLGNDGKR